MYQTTDLSGYGSCVEEEFDLAHYEGEYYSAPQVTTVSGSNLSDFVYNSVDYEQPNSEVLYPVMSVVHGGTTYYYYPECVYIVPVCYYVPVSFAYGDPVGYVNPYAVEPNLNGAAEMRCDYVCNDPPEDNGEMPLCHYAPSEAVTSLAMYYDEVSERLNESPFKSDDDRKKDDDKKNDGDKNNNDDNGVSSLGQKKSTNPDCVNESSAYKKFSSEIEERRKIVGASSQVQKTFINRGVVADPSEYRKFCGSVEDRLKKLSESSPGKKITTNRDTAISSYRKFFSTVEERRRILNDSSVGKKSYVNRGVVADSSEYRKFCRSVEDRIKNLRPPENSQTFRDQDFIAKHGSKVAHVERVVHEGNSESFMDMILKSPEYLHVQDNLKNSKHYRDILYKQALKKQNKSILMEILPSIVEEPFNLDDVTSECGELHVAEPRELDSIDEHKPVINKMKQPKNRLKSFRNWLAKTFCCCCTTNQPP